MICSKVHRVLLKEQQQKQQQLVAGITDYLPHSLRNSQNINISIVGNHEQIVNHVLWNQFFSKTFLKESYYFMLNHHSTEGHQTTTAVFLKKDGKVYKMEEILQWQSPLRAQLLQNKSQSTSLQIESFTNKGNIKKISIYLSDYPIYNQKMTILLKVGSLQAPAISKNNTKIHYTTEEKERVMQETDRVNIKNQQQSSKITHSSNNNHKTKISQLSINSHAKKSKRQKQNGKNSFVTISQKQPSLKNRTSSKKSVREAVFKKMKETQSIAPSSKISYETKSILDYSTRPINRQSVLSKIVTSKQEQIVLLKEQIYEKQQEYEVILKEIQQSHDRQVNKLTHDVKQVLSSYSKSQKEVLDENLYLKDRVNVLQETLSKNNTTLERYSGEMEDYIARIREFEETNKRINEMNRKMQQQITQSRQNYNKDRLKMQSEVNLWRQKAQEYRNKYEKIVDTMKIVLHQT